jgi:hypothetical protein
MEADMTTLELVKVARIRQPGYPVGVPAPMYLNCPCGAKPEAPDLVVECACGRVYDANGYLQKKETH